MKNVTNFSPVDPKQCFRVLRAYRTEAAVEIALFRNFEEAKDFAALEADKTTHFNSVSVRAFVVANPSGVVFAEFKPTVRERR